MRLKDNIKLFENGKVQIIQLWIDNPNVLSVLNKYNIDQKLFIKSYAFDIFDYYIDVVNGIKEIGDCPVIDKLLIFLKDKDIGANELFVLCTGFKNGLIEFMYKINLNSLDMQKDILYVYEKNFEGVLKKYSQTIQNINKHLNLSNSLIDNNIITSSTDLAGDIISASQAFANLSGYTKYELIGQPHNIVRHQDMPKEIFQDMWETISSGKTWRGEIKNLKKCGDFYWVFATISPNFDSDKKIVSYSAIEQDITAKKEVENQQDLIIEQSKSAAMGELIAMLAHQWRQPLQATAMMVQQLSLEKMLDGKLSDETLETVTNDIQKQLDYMSKTIDNFRDFFKPEKHKEVVRISTLIAKLDELISYTLKVDDIEFSVDIKDDIEINIHLNDILQVLINIVKNARDALVELPIKHKKIIVKVYKKNKNIIITIKDNAGGISNEIIDRIFDAYFTTKANKNGTGLGLYMSKNIIENHGQGLLSVKNEDGGAIFKITLPIK